MTTYVLVEPDGRVTSKLSASATTLAASKGRWALFVDNPPADDPAQPVVTRTVPANVPSGDVVVQYTQRARTAAELRSQRDKLYRNDVLERKARRLDRAGNKVGALSLRIQKET